MSEHRMRMGPVTILTFLVLLVMAVMAVLGVSTVNAQNAIEQRQRETVAATYRNEATAQAFLACLDGVLANAQDRDNPWEAAHAAFPDAKALQHSLSDPCREMGVQAAEVTNLDWGGNQLTVVFQSDGFRQLTATVVPEAQQRYVVTQWNTETLWEEEEGTGLWTGQ